MKSIPDLAEVPPVPAMSGVRKQRLQALRDRPKQKIDYSEIPPLRAEWFKRAHRMRDARPAADPKRAVRLDADVMQWIDSLGADYERKVNAMLRAAMKAATGPNGR